MLRTTFLSIVVLVALLELVRSIAPVALKQDNKPSTADLEHPPTVYGASAIVTAPPEKRR